jgi:hypothetical protein
VDLRPPVRVTAPTSNRTAPNEYRETHFIFFYVFVRNITSAILTCASISLNVSQIPDGPVHRGYGSRAGIALIGPKFVLMSGDLQYIAVVWCSGSSWMLYGDRAQPLAPAMTKDASPSQPQAGAADTTAFSSDWNAEVKDVPHTRADVGWPPG